VVCTRLAPHGVEHVGWQNEDRASSKASEFAVSKCGYLHQDVWVAVLRLVGESLAQVLLTVARVVPVYDPTGN